MTILVNNYSNAQSVSGDLKFWQKSDFLGFDQVGDCEGKSGDISSVFARTTGESLFLRITFDDMIIRKENQLTEDLFINAGITLRLKLTDNKQKSTLKDFAFDLSALSSNSENAYQLRTPVFNLWEMETSLPEKMLRENIDFEITVFENGKMIDVFNSDGKNSDAEGNCAFVHHGNQGLTYTEVFYGSSGGQSGLAGSGFDEILQVHEATATPGNFHMSGTLMPAAAWHNPEFNTWLNSLVSQGKVEMMTSALGQHIMPFVTNNMNDWSVGVESDMVDYHYNYEPRTAWVPERVWLAPGSYPNSGVLDWAGDNWAQHGVWGVVLDDSPHLNGYDNGKIHWMNNGSGVSLRVIPINNSFVGNMMYNADGAKNQISGMGQYKICVYGTDWEVASEMNEHDGSSFLDNYENVLWWCHDNYPGVNVWKLTDAMQNSNFNGTGAEITPGTYGLLGGPDGYGGSNNSWYNQWAGTESHSDFHNPKWNYGYIWSDAHNNLMTAPNNDLAQLGWYTLMINLHETGWHEGGTVAGWEHRYSSHMKNANVYAEAARWAAGQYQSPLAAYFSDIDHDGVDEVVIHNQNIFAVFESIGGKVNWLFYKDGYGNAFSVVGSDMAYWSETDGDYNDASNNHVAALSDVDPNQQGSIYQIEILQSSGDMVVVELSQWGVKKRIELTAGVNFLDVIYNFYGTDGYIKSGWTPGLLDILWSGKSHLQRMWGDYGSYCGQRNSASGATVAMVFGNGGAQHNGEFEGTLVKGDEIKGNNQFKTRLFAGYTSPPTGTKVTELNTLSAQNLDVFPPTLNNLAYRIDENTLEIVFSEAVDLASSQNVSNYSLQNFAHSYTLVSAVRQGDWRKVQLNISGTWFSGDAGQIVVSNVKDVNGNAISGSNTANYTVPSGTTPHTIVIDGTNDFEANSELMAFKTYSLYLTWDNQNLYVGLYNLNLNIGGDFFVNIDTDHLTGSGATNDSWGRVSFANPYKPEYQVAIEGGSKSIQLNKWTGTSWQYKYFGSNGCNSYEGWSENGLTEISIPWDSIGNPAGIAVSAHVSAEDTQVVPVTFPITNPTGNHPTLTKVWAFYTPYVGSAMPASGVTPKNAIVLPNLAPTINSYLPTQLTQSVELGGTINFSVTATDPESGQLYYAWLLDGVAVSQTSVYNFVAGAGMAGTHQVSVTVNDGVPGNTTNPVTWQVTVLPGSQLIAGFSGNITTVCLGNSVQFSDQSNGPVTGWQWTFEGGNPATSTAQNPLVVYPAKGTFDVTLTISDGTNSQSLSKTDYILVNSETTVSAGIDFESCGNQAAQITGTASDYSLVLWTTAGDGMFSNTSSVSTLYTPGTGDKAAGYAQLTLTAFPLSPCPNSATDIMLLGLLATPEITLQPISQTVYSGDDVVFEIAATGSGTITYQWFGPAGIIEDENGTQLLLSQVTTADAGNYYCVATNSCGSKTSLPALLTVTDLPVQNIQIPNGWSGISSYLDIQNPMVASMFSPITADNSLIILQNYTTMYWPAEQINTIDQNGGWNSGSGYQIKVNGNQVLPVSGIPLQDKTLNYAAGGWYLMPVLNECGVAPAVLFAPIPGKVVIVKEIAGMRVYWPGVFQNLMVLEPGKAYTAKFTEAVTFAYPDCGGTKNSPAIEANNDFTGINPGPDSHVIVLEGKATSGLQKGDQIEISTACGLLIGRITMTNPGETVGLPVFEDDPTTIVHDGFTTDDEMIFRILRNDQVFDLKPEFDEKWDQNLLKNNGMSLVKSATISPSNANQAGNIEISFYPNPSINQIIFGGIETPFQVSVFNSVGQKVVDLLLETPQMDISKLKPGMYNVRVYKGELMNSKKFIKE
jgi:PKD repeat protein